MIYIAATVTYLWVSLALALWLGFDVEVEDA